MSMALWDKQKQMGMIMQRRQTSQGPEMASMKNQVEKTEDGELDGKHMAAEEMISHMKNGNAMDFKKSLENFMDMHLNGRDEESEPTAEDDAR